MSIKSVAPARPRSQGVVTPLGAIVVQSVHVRPDGHPIECSPPISGAAMAALLDVARGLWGDDLAGLTNSERVESRAQDFAGLADALIGAEDFTESRAADAMAILRDGFKELAYRVRAVSGVHSSYNVVVDGEAR